MFCKNCGKELNEGSIFCSACGVKQTNIYTKVFTRNGLSEKDFINLQENKKTAVKFYRSFSFIV